MKPRWQRWIVWLLPFLVARALVPAGFMLSVGDSGLTLTFCPSAAPDRSPSAASAGAQEQPPIALSAAAAHHADSLHDAHAHDHGSAAEQQHHSDHYRASDTSVCPFGVIGGACADASVRVAHLFIDSAFELPPLYTAPPDANRLIRADRIRGPPSVLLT